jgi:ABC-type glycerol-3-phosphate transport system permease component
VNSPASVRSGNAVSLRRRRRVWKAARLTPAWLLMVALAATTIYPLVFVSFTAFKTVSQFASDALGAPNPPTLENLQAVVARGVLTTNALNSAVISVVGVAFTVTVSIMAGFALAQLNFPFRRGLLIGITGLMIQPVALLMIPIVLTVNALGLLNNFVGIELVYCGLATPFGTYLMYSYLRTQPREILDAARVDGASTLRVLWSIAMPLAAPAIGALITLDFISFWNEFLFALLLLENNDQRTVIVTLSTLQAEQFLNVPLVAAGMLISIVPPLTVFILLHRRLFTGITAGSLK